MIYVKHFMDSVSPGEGPRLWVEPLGLTLDLLEWCRIDLLMRDFAPNRILWEWYYERPGTGRYQVFSQAYRKWLLEGPCRASLQALAQLARNGDITLLHQCTDSTRNSGTVLRDAMEELIQCAQTQRQGAPPTPK
jgi:uncharacterized protein YeaO (DUF488 family)